VYRDKNNVTITTKATSRRVALRYVGLMQSALEMGQYIEAPHIRYRFLDILYRIGDKENLGHFFDNVAYVSSVCCCTFVRCLLYSTVTQSEVTK